MAQEYFKTESNRFGNVEIAFSVIEHIARVGIEEIEGISIVDTSFRKGVNALFEKGRTTINVDVKVKYGFNADRAARQIQERIVKDARQMADVVVDHVNVNVHGFNF